MSRKNIKTAVFYIFLLFTSILYLSCSMFTESWAKRAARNQYDVLKNASTEELADISFLLYFLFHKFQYGLFTIF